MTFVVEFKPSSLLEPVKIELGLDERSHLDLSTALIRTISFPIPYILSTLL